MCGDVVDELNVPEDVACEALAGGEFFFAFGGKVACAEVGDRDVVSEERIDACSATNGLSDSGLSDTLGGFLRPCQ